MDLIEALLWFCQSIYYGKIITPIAEEYTSTKAEAVLPIVQGNANYFLKLQFGISYPGGRRFGMGSCKYNDIFEEK